MTISRALAAFLQLDRGDDESPRRAFDIAVDIIHVNRVAGFGVHDVADTADVAGNDGEASTGNLEEDIRETVGLPGSIEKAS